MLHKKSLIDATKTKGLARVVAMTKVSLSSSEIRTSYPSHSHNGCQEVRTDLSERRIYRVVYYQNGFPS